MKVVKSSKIEASLLYICPNINCKIEHWLFLRESQTHNFKIVCECGTVFKPKTIKNITVKYFDPIQTEIKPSTKDIISNKILNQCVRILSQYGFDKTESETLIKKAHADLNTSDPAQLVKIVLQSLEIKS